MKNLTGVVCGTLLLFFSHVGRAQSVGYAYAGTGTSAGYAVSADVEFTISAGQIVITLENTTPHTDDAGQLLTGIKFSLSPELATAVTMTAATGDPRNIYSNGSYADSAAVSLMSTWEALTSKSGICQLDFNPNAQFAIVGPADGETATTAGNYIANGSIDANNGHNPYTAISATFTLTDSGITADTEISNVTFVYGTQLNTFVPGQPTTFQQVPEISTGAFGFALLGVCFVARRRSPATSLRIS